MKKILLGLFLIFSMSVGAVETQSTDPVLDCRDAKDLSGKIGNFNEADLDDGKSFRVCDQMLLPEDNILIANLRHIATPENVMQYADQIREMGGDPEKIASFMEDRSMLMQWITDLSVFAWFFGVVYIIVVAVGSNLHSSLIPNATLATGKVILFLFMFTGIDQVYTKFLYNYVGTQRALIYNQADHKTLDSIREMDFTTLIPSVNKNSTELASFVHYIEFLNVSTELSRKRIFGQDIEIEIEWGFDINDPTIQEYLDYEDVCSQTDYVVVDRELNLHFANFNYSNLANEAIFYSGSDDTAEYNCSTNHFGRPVEVGRVINNTPTLIKRFFLDNFSENMADDLTFKDEVSAAMNDLSGTLSLEMEEAEKIASNNKSNIKILLQLAQSAQEEARTSNVDIFKTSSYAALEEMHFRNMGSLFDFEEIEGLTSISNITYQGLKLNHYNFADMFGIGTEKDPIVADKRDIGYHYAQSFIRQTASYQAELDCAINDGENYRIREKFAQNYNSTSKDEQLRLATSFGGENAPHCFRFNDNGTITAGGNGETKKEFALMVKDRVLAYDLYQTARMKAGIRHILENDQLDTQLILDALNSITPDMYGAMKSYATLSKTRQQIVGSMSTLGDAYDFVYSLTFDTTKPQTYYNYLRMQEQNNQDSVNVSKGLPMFDLTNYFSHSFVALNENGLNQKKDAEGSLAKMARFVCPVINDNGKCGAGLYELTISANEMMFEQSTILASIHYTSSAMSGVCGAIDKSVDSTVGAVAGKARYFTPAGAACVVIQGLNGGSNLFIKPLMGISMTAWAATELASYVPIMIDLVFLFIGPVCFVIPFVIALALLLIDTTTSSVKFLFFSKREENDYLELLALERTTRTVKSAVIIAIISLVVLVVVSEVLRSPQIGGSVYDAFFYGYDNSIHQSLFRTFGVIAAIVLFVIKIGFQLPIKLINQSLELTDTKGQTLTDNASNFVEGMFTHYVLNKFSNTAKVASSNLDKGIKGLSGATVGKTIDNKIKKNKDILAKNNALLNKEKEETYETETKSQSNKDSDD